MKKELDLLKFLNNFTEATINKDLTLIRFIKMHNKNSDKKNIITYPVFSYFKIKDNIIIECERCYSQFKNYKLLNCKKDYSDNTNIRMRSCFTGEFC